MTRQSKSNLYYVLGLLVLIGGAAGMQAAKARGWLYVIKKPLPLHKPIADLNRDTLLPYDVLEMAPLSSEMEQELGTLEYLMWVLQEPGNKRRGEQEVVLSVSYYTNVQDQVPHVPEECYGQGGNLPLDDESLEMRLDSINESIAVRRLAFNRPRELVKRTYVYYTICVNGQFCSDRTTVRLRMADPRDSHLYYSKVEIAFEDMRESDAPLLDKKAGELLDKVISELMKSHWPARGSERGGEASPLGESQSRAAEKEAPLN
ncbi:MAG TPA: exosortase-associated EpsI family protein [Phycisphaerae bacterium]|nr:exosortase-associated EpsI family protein [Phycisphaerae bacterium]